MRDAKMDSAAIVSAAESAAKSLGYTRLKDKQREVIMHLLYVFATHAVVINHALDKSFASLASFSSFLATKLSHILNTCFEGSLLKFLRSDALLDTSPHQGKK